MSRKLLVLFPALALAGPVGCVGSSNRDVRHVEAPVNVTHEMAFGDYRRVFNTAYHILNRYAVIQNSSYRYGEINALVSEDTQLFDKTRKTIQARIFNAGDYYEVECRVLIAVEDSEVATWPDQFHPRYEWKTVASDSRLEVRLNNEIRAALSGGAWEAKEPLTPQPIRPAAPAAPRKAVQPDEDTDEVRVVERVAAESSARRGGEALERVGVDAMRVGDYDRAESAFRASIEAEPKGLFAHYLLAQAQFSQGAFTQAAVALDRATRTNPDWVRAPVDVREFYAEPTVFRSRLLELQAATRDDPELTFLLGYMAYFSQDLEGALAAFDRHLEQHPGDPVAKGYRDLTVSQLEAAKGLEAF